MTTRDVIPIHNGWTIVSSNENEASYRFVTKTLALRHKAALERLEAAREHDAAYMRHCRLEAARRYLCEREARRPPMVQLDLFA